MVTTRSQTGEKDKQIATDEGGLGQAEARISLEQLVLQQQEQTRLLTALAQQFAQMLERQNPAPQPQAQP